MKIYDKEVYSRQEEVRNVIIIIISFLVGFGVGYMANTITSTNNTVNNTINTLSKDNTVNETEYDEDNTISESLLEQYNIKNIA